MSKYVVTYRGSLVSTPGSFNTIEEAISAGKHRARELRMNEDFYGVAKLVKLKRVTKTITTFEEIA